MAVPKSRINLYNPTLGSRASAQKPWWMLGIVGAIIAVVVVLVMQAMETWRLTHEIAHEEEARNMLKKERALQDDRLKSLTSGVSSQVTTASAELVDMVNQRMAWLALFQEMSFRVPDGVWLLKVDIQAVNTAKTAGKSAGPRTITMSGFARSHQEIGQLLSALEASPKFEAVSLKFAERHTERGGEQVNFEINGRLS